MDKAYKSIYERYGVEDEKGLDEIMASAQECQATKMLYDEIVKENKALKEKIAFSENGILADKQDDVRTYFKGKGLEMSDEALKSVIQTHPEWIAKKEAEAPRTTIIPLGGERQEGDRPPGAPHRGAEKDPPQCPQRRRPAPPAGQREPVL